MRIKFHSFLPLICIIILICLAICYLLFFMKDSDPQTMNSNKTNSDVIIIPSETPINETDTVDQNSNLDASSDASSDTVFSNQTDMVSLSKEALRKLSAGTIIDPTTVGDIMENCFYYESINDEIKLRITGKSYKDDCTVPFEELRYIRVLYYGFDQQTHVGELIVNTEIAQDIVDIFAELYNASYPIEEMVLIDEYDADDNTSMAANNTSCFNFRIVPGSTHLSKHAYGLAIDINPLYNPYVQYNEDETVILPEEGIPYADRTLDCPYYIDEEDLCYQVFIKRGFTWGGAWESEPDYQHFQKTID